MRVLLVVDCYYPETKSSARLVHDLGAEMRQQGHEVIVLAPSESIQHQMEISTGEGLRIVRVKTGKLKGAAKVLRAIREVRLSETLWHKAGKFLRANPCDLIVFYSPSIFFGSLVRRLKALWGCPAYLILRDIFPQWAVDTGLLRKGAIYHFFRWKELVQYAAADVIGVQSPANLAYFAESLPQRKYQLDVLYNWTAINQDASPATNYRAQLGLQDKVVFFYGGNIGVAQDLDNIVRLAASLRDEPQAYFLLVGDGSETERLKALITEQKLSNIRLLPAVGQQEYQAMLAEFDVGLVSLDRKLKTQNFPGKILGYLDHALPILASLNPGNDLGEVLAGHDVGLCSFNGDDHSLRAHALQLARDAALRTQMGQNGRQLLAARFAVSATVSQILAHFAHAPAVQYTDRIPAEIPLGATLGTRLR